MSLADVGAVEEEMLQYYMFTSYYYGVAGSRSVKAYVRDMYGNDLDHKKITIIGSNGGKTTGYSGDMIPLPSGSTVVLKFAGDKKYMPSTFTIHFVWGFKVLSFFIFAYIYF